MLIDSLVSTRRAGVAQRPEQAFEPGAALLRAAGAGSRPPFPHPATLQASGRVAVLLEHRLSDVHSPRRVLGTRPWRWRWALLRD
eukprot:1328954-Alexandrium_andersonii.AAC.1